jgi:hypothetical protein
MILLMPDHGETVTLADDASYDDVLVALDRLFKNSRCESVTVATRTLTSSEVCDNQLLVPRNSRTYALLDDLRQRVLAHVPYNDPLADPCGMPLPDPENVPQGHPTLWKRHRVTVVDIIECYPYHLACALDQIMSGDLNRAIAHLERELALRGDGG